MKHFSEQIAVVTGASSGIGRAITLALAAHGATVCLLGRNCGALDELATTMRSTAPQSSVYPVDLGHDAALHKVAGQIRHAYGRVDLLVHSAGVLRMGRIAVSPIEEFDYQYRVNVRAPYLLTQALLPELIHSQGQIVLVNSSAGLGGRANLSAYCASKAALKAFADSLRDEVNEEGVRVLSVYPGRTATPMQMAIFAAEGREFPARRLLQPEDIAEAVIGALVLPRSAEVTDIHIRPFAKT